MSLPKGQTKKATVLNAFVAFMGIIFLYCGPNVKNSAGPFQSKRSYDLELPFT